MNRWRVTLMMAVGIALACQRGPSTNAQDALSLQTPPPAEAETTALDVAHISDDPVVQTIVMLGRTDGRVHEHLRTLTKEIGPRLTSSHNLMRAEVWCREQFEAWGLVTRLERWGEFAVGFDRGPAFGGMVKPQAVAWEFTTPAWTPGALGPLRGPALLAPTTLKELAALGDRASGAWIVEPKGGWPDAKVREKLLNGLRKANMAGRIRRARSNEGLVHTHGRYAIRWDALPQDVEVIVRADQYDDLVRRLGEQQAVELEMSIDNRFFRGPVPQHNVVAEITGASRPEEVVIVGGHLDSWDGAEGANDNGTGVATTMEAARLLVQANAKPMRTIRFVLWSGEEQGLLGSRAYVEAHHDELERISAVFVHDGGTNYLSGIGITPEMKPQMERVFAPVMKLADDKSFELEIVEGLRTGGSDHTPFIVAGVPGFFWQQAGDADYDYVHHTQHDTLEHAIEDYQRHSAMVVAIAAYNLANLEALLDRTHSAPLPRRRLDADFEGTVVKGATKGGAAAAAGWRAGDRLVELDGEAIESLRPFLGRLQEGEPRKRVLIDRAGKTIETVLDFSADPAEAERTERRRAREAAGTSP